MHGAEDDLGLVADLVLDHARNPRHLVDGEVRAARDVDQHALRAPDRDVLEQRRGDGVARRREGAVLAPPHPRAHQRGAARGHDGAHVGEVDVDLAAHPDQVADPLGGLQQHLVGLLERVAERGALPDHREQLLVGHDDHGVHGAGQLLQSLLRLAQALLPLEVEGTRDHGDHERSQLAGHLADDRAGARARATAHSGGDEDQVGALDRGAHLVGVLGDGLAADSGTGSRPQALGEPLAELDGGGRLGRRERLGVGVGRDEFDALQLLVDHPVDRVAAGAPDADDPHQGPVPRGFVEFEDHGVISFGWDPWSRGVGVSIRRTLSATPPCG